MEDVETADGGGLTESLQLQAMMLTIKAMIATHPQPEKLGDAMRDVFAQFQSEQFFLTLPSPQRLWAREVFSNLLSGIRPPEPSQPSDDPAS